MKENKLSFRKAIFEDLERLEQIDKQCFSEDIAYDLNYFIYLFNCNDTDFFLLEENNIIVGFIIGWQKFKEGGEIVTIDVHPDYQRQGIGQALLDKLTNLYKNDKKYKFITLQVDITNKKAINFYQKNLYKTQYTIKHYYGANQHAYLMKKMLI